VLVFWEVFLPNISSSRRHRILLAHYYWDNTYRLGRSAIQQTWRCRRKMELLFQLFSTCRLHFMKLYRNILLYCWFQVFQGNFDQNTYKINMFPQPITARYVRLVVLTWHNHICMRMEYLICWLSKDRPSHRSHSNWADSKVVLSFEKCK